MAKQVDLFNPVALLYGFAAIMLFVLVFVVKQKTCQSDSTGDLRSTFWWLGCSGGESEITSASTQ